MTDTLTTFDRRSHEGSLLIAKAKLASTRADEAFRRYIIGEVETSSAATRLMRQADEAWATVRIEITYGPEIEAGWSEEQIRELEREEEKR